MWSSTAPLLASDASSLNLLDLDQLRLNAAAVDAALGAAFLRDLWEKRAARAEDDIPLPEFLTERELATYEAEMASAQVRFVADATPAVATALSSPLAASSSPSILFLWRPTGRTNHGPRPVHRKGSRRNGSRGSPDDDPDGEPPPRHVGPLMAGVA